MKFFHPQLLLPVIALSVLIARLLVPSDMDTKDQPRTVSYTVDIVESGSWTWPQDLMGRSAFKPPFYNWLGAPVLHLTGVYSALTLKLPALLTGLACLLPMGFFVRHLSLQLGAANAPPWTAFAFAGFAWLTNFSVYGLIYTARPDMVFCFCLFAAWTLSTLLIDESPLLRGPRALWIFALWLAILAAILTKGTPVLLSFLYMPIYSLWRHRSLRPLLKLQFPAGVLLTMALIVAWHQLIWIHLPAVDRDFLVNVESKRIAESSVWKSLTGIYKMPQYFLVRYLPWSLVFLGLFFTREKTRTLRPLLAPIFAWFFLVLLFFTIPVFKRDDYLLPVYPVCSIAAGFAMTLLARNLRILITAVASCLMVGAVIDDFFFKEHLLPRYDDNTREFAHQTRGLVPEGRPLLFFDTGYNNFKAYLGTNQAPSQADLRSLPSNTYFVKAVHLLTHDQARGYRVSGADLKAYEPVKATLPQSSELLALSKPLPQVHGSRPGLLGLYRVR